MKKYNSISLILCLILAEILLFNICIGKANDADRVVIAEFEWRGKQQITFEDMMKEISQLPEHKQRQYQSKEGLVTYMQLMAESRLILCLAKDKKLNEDPQILQKVKDYHHELIGSKRRIGHPENFQVTSEHFKKLEDYTHQLMIEKLTEIEVDAKVSYTDEDLMSYYEAHKNYYVSEAKVRATCITFKDEDLANKTLKVIKAGRDIIEMAKQLFEEGKLADGPGTTEEDPGNTFFFSRTASIPWSEFINAVFVMKVGEMTDVVFETKVNDETYYLIFRKEEQQPARNQSFDEAKNDVERKVKQNKQRTRIIEWITELSEKGRLKTYPKKISELFYLGELTVQTPQQIAKKALASTVLVVMEDANRHPLSSGSGFFVERGMIATNLHVVEGVLRGYVKRVGTDRKYPIAGIVAMDSRQDLAIIKVSDIGAPFLPLGKSDKVQVGESVYIAGNPIGFLEGTFSDGIVSGVRKFKVSSERIQITAPISKGSSGGPVLNSKGEVIGIAVSTITAGQNLNFAIPANYLKKLLSKVGTRK